MPRLLTGDVYFNAVVEWEEAQQDEERQKEERAKARNLQNIELAAWEQEDQKRREWNAEKTCMWKEALAAWEAKQMEAKANKIKLKDWDNQNPKPKAKDPKFMHERAAPKPKIRNTKMKEVADDGECKEIAINEEEISSEDNE
ncbi:hypothetical protein VKT23_011335 [Stygiomarasmius scandens]|uniref:Uncharacterized protein n=1 Tax=Marasmiellus scandens TaxID=2682957 RepID=A0ABR1JA39_9AGAR